LSIIGGRMTYCLKTIIDKGTVRVKTNMDARKKDPSGRDQNTTMLHVWAKRKEYTSAKKKKLANHSHHLISSMSVRRKKRRSKVRGVRQKTMRRDPKDKIRRKTFSRGLQGTVLGAGQCEAPELES